MPHLGGYDQQTKNQYRNRFGSNPPLNTKQPAWVQFRANLLTDYLKGLRSQIKTKDSNCLLSISPSPFKFGLDNVLQDSEIWLKQGLVDFLCPQWYREKFSAYRAEVDRVASRFSSRERKKIVPGIAFTANRRNLTASDLVKCVNHNRTKGLGGQVFFFYEGLTNNSNQMALTLYNSADYSKLAPLPTPPFP